MSPVAKYWNGTAWTPLAGLPVYEQPDQPAEPVPSGSVWVDTDAPQPAVYPKLLNVQRMLGGGSTYVGIGSGNQFVVSGGALLQLSYTPPVDAWWEVNLHVGLLQCLSAAYVLAQPGITLTPVDVDSAGTIYDYRTQHSAVQAYESYNLSFMFKLVAGVAYTISTIFTAGRRFSVPQASGMLHMHGKAWSR